VRRYSHFCELSRDSSFQYLIILKERRVPELHPPLSIRQLTGEIVPLESVSVNSQLGLPSHGHGLLFRLLGGRGTGVTTSSSILIMGRGNAERRRELRALPTHA
jgi:hypothetical protein